MYWLTLPTPLVLILQFHYCNASLCLFWRAEDPGVVTSNVDNVVIGGNCNQWEHLILDLTGWTDADTHLRFSRGLLEQSLRSGSETTAVRYQWLH
jgi:hypothetical protein